MPPVTGQASPSVRRRALWFLLEKGPGFLSEKVPPPRRIRRLSLQISWSKEGGDELGGGSRHDFTIDILGGATGPVYATDYRDVDGIIIPTTRRGYAWQGDYLLVPEPRLVAIDMGEITIR